MISFIMPAYKSLYLRDAIDSIVSQSFEDWELIVVDDCSPEDLADIVELYEDRRVRYYKNEKNIGGHDLVGQWNHCLQYAEGDWVVLAADDDVYMPSFADEIHRLSIKYPEVDLIRSRVEQIDEGGNHLWDDGQFNEFVDKVEYLSDWISGKAFTCIGNYAFRKSALNAIGGFVEYPCGFGSDIETPIRLSRYGVANTLQMLFRFRQSPIHLSSDKGRYVEKLSGITQLSSFLRSIEYRSVEYDGFYLQKKCIFDYYHLVIKYLPFSRLGYIRYCTYASFVEKFIMILRWMKDKLIIH